MGGMVQRIGRQLKMDMFVLYPVVAVSSLLIWYFAVRIAYFRRGSREKKQRH
jgi:hypothetical protein